MKVITLPAKRLSRRQVLSALFVGILFWSCNKEVSHNKNTSSPTTVSGLTGAPRINPFSLRNIEKAAATLNSKNARLGNSMRTADNLPKYVYFNFNPTNMTTEEFQILEHDTTVNLMYFPFADMRLYDEAYGFNETKAQQLNDGTIYGVTNYENRTALGSVGGDSRLQPRMLDTLALIPQEDTALQYQAYREAGFTEDQINQFRICLFKRPHGYVRYWDNELIDPATGTHGRLEPVRGMQVWALWLGIPLHTYTDDNGHYNFPWLFSAGTIMGTHAKNPRVNVKPLNTTGSGPRVQYQIESDFIVGSVYVLGLVTSCQMKTEVEFEFYGHTKPRYWSQILNAYYFHDKYSIQDDIRQAPDAMTCYAHWKDGTGFGDASTPLLGHITDAPYINNVLAQGLFITPAIQSLMNFIHGLLPDMTISVGADAEPTFYNSLLAQTIFHELGHASQYWQVGESWYKQMEAAELAHHGYGNPPYTDDGKVQVAEAWAEFMGNHDAYYRYGTSAGWDILTTTENEAYFNSTWISTGIFYDLMDDLNPSEPWDQVSGATVANMYNAFSPATTTMCYYRSQFMALNSAFNNNDVLNLFDHYVILCQ